jgi:Smr domain
MIVLDLHDFALREAFVRVSDAYNLTILEGSFEQLDVIHGRGGTDNQGLIRRSIRCFLETHGNYVDYRLGEELDHNPGHTILRAASLRLMEVIPLSGPPYAGLSVGSLIDEYLPSAVSGLAEGVSQAEQEVLRLCEQALTEVELVRRLPLGHIRVRQTIHRLVVSGRLREVSRRESPAYLRVPNLRSLSDGKRLRRELDAEIAEEFAETVDQFDALLDLEKELRAKKSTTQRDGDIPNAPDGNSPLA